MVRVARAPVRPIADSPLVVASKIVGYIAVVVLSLSLVWFLLRRQQTTQSQKMAVLSDEQLKATYISNLVAMGSDAANPAAIAKSTGRRVFTEADLPPKHRIVLPGHMYTMDYDEERLNLHVVPFDVANRRDVSMSTFLTQNPGKREQDYVDLLQRSTVFAIQKAKYG